VRVGVVGCGLIGSRRIETATRNGDVVEFVADVDEESAEEAATACGASWTTNWRELAAAPELEAVVVATHNKHAAEITTGLLEAGKHVLCEKPLGRTADEAAHIVAAARASGRVLKVGFNHRHHPALSRAHSLASAGEIGALLSIRAAYGHGGRAGYENEWRSDRDLAGGGELLDQGVHIIDLCRWFLDEVVEVAGFTATLFWPVEIEDNAFALLRTRSQQVATLHTSWTQWKNLFRFEIFGRDGYLTAEGLGGSYGEERLTHGIRPPEGGIPDERSWAYPGEDVSWTAEWTEFSDAIREGREPLGNGVDGLEAARIIDAIYEASRLGRAVALDAE